MSAASSAPSSSAWASRRASSTSESRLRPSSEAAQPSSSRRWRDHCSSTSGENTRRPLRRRRAATRIWCTESGRSRRTRTSCSRNLRTWVRMWACTASPAGSPGETGGASVTSGSALAAGPRALPALLEPPGIAPWASRSATTGSSTPASSTRASTSSSRNRAATTSPSMIETTSSTSSATGVPSASNSTCGVRAVCSVATGANGLRRARAVTTSAIAHGTCPTSPAARGSRTSSRTPGPAPSTGSLRCQPSSAPPSRRRSVTPQRISRRSSVSW